MFHHVGFLFFSHWVCTGPCLYDTYVLQQRRNAMSDQWKLDGWYYMKAGTRIGPVLSEYIVCLVRAEELRPSEKVFQRWASRGDYRFTECEARIA